jgi:hypothetical protein
MMRAHLHPPLRLREAVPAREMLGPEHELVRTLELQDVVHRDLLVLGALLPATLGAAALGSDSAVRLAGAAAAVALALAAFAAVLRIRRRDAAVALIGEGRAELPLPAVAEERARLLDPAYRRTLARSLSLLRWRAAEHSEWFVTSAVPYDVSMLRSVAGGMREVEELLTGDEVNVRGVALARTLLVDGCSPLHGHDPRRLGEELCRIAASLR